MRLIFYRSLNFESSKKPCSRTGSAGLLLCTIQCSCCAFNTVILLGWPLSVCLDFLLPPENLPVSKIFLEIFKKAGRIGCFRCHISGKGKIHPTSPRKGGEKMEAIPRNDGEQYRFDAFCKAVLRNEARNYHRNKKRLLDREKSFSVLSMEELGQLTSVDHYPSEEFVFSSYGCDLHIDNELVANAFAALPKQEQSILILFCVLELGDGEIGDLMGMSRSAVQRHRTKTLNELPKKLKAHLPEGG